MKRTLAVLLIGFISLLVVVLLATRIGLAYVVASDEFRSEFNSNLERSLRSLLPTAMTDVKELAVTGVASLEIKDLSVHSSKLLDVGLAVPRTRVTPVFSSLLGTGPLRFDADALLGGGGRLVVATALPKGLLVPSLGSSPSAAVTVSGTMAEVSAVTLAGLLFPENAGPNFQLSSGLLGGTFSLSKPLGSKGHGHKSGDLALKLEASTWRLPPSSAPGDNLTLTLPPINANLEIHDFRVGLKSPLVIAEKSGRTTLNGALLLSPRADGAARWDLDVVVDGDTGTAGKLARLFRCKSPPAGSHFRILGPVTSPLCE
jgi:hypothetical protein